MGLGLCCLRWFPERGTPASEDMYISQPDTHQHFPQWQEWGFLSPDLQPSCMHTQIFMSTRTARYMKRPDTSALSWPSIRPVTFRGTQFKGRGKWERGPSLPAKKGSWSWCYPLPLFSAGRTKVCKLPFRSPTIRQSKAAASTALAQ